MVNAASLIAERAAANRQIYLLMLYISLNAITVSLYSTPYSEYALSLIFDGDIVEGAFWVTSVNSFVMYTARFIGSPIIGAISDKQNRRVMFVASVVVFYFCMAIFVFFPSIPTMILGSFASGFVNAEPVQQSYVADLTRIFVRTDSVANQSKASVAPDAEVEEKEITPEAFGKKSR